MQMNFLVSLHKLGQIDVSKKYIRRILYLILPWLDNLLLKTFGVAVKVPNSLFAAWCSFSFKRGSKYMQGFTGRAMS